MLFLGHLKSKRLLGNLSATSDHCSAGRYGFHSTTPTPSNCATSTHWKSPWTCTEKNWLFRFIIFDNVVKFIKLVSYPKEFQCIILKYLSYERSHTETEIRRMYSPPYPLLVDNDLNSITALLTVTDSLFCAPACF